MKMPNPWANMVQIYESVDKPHTYACVVHHSTKKGSPRSRSGVEMVELAPRGSTFEFAFVVFQKFFGKKCGVEWDNRQREQDHNIDECNSMQDERMLESETRVGSEATDGSEASTKDGGSSTVTNIESRIACRHGEQHIDHLPLTHAENHFKYVPNDQGMIKKLLSVTENRAPIQL